MKKVIIAAVALGIIATTAYAGRMGSGGVKRISNAGDGRYHVYCNSGDRVISSVGQGWGDGTGNSFGESYYGLSLQEAAEKGCR